MEYTQLGKTGISISKVCVGCMSFGKAGTMHDWTLDEAESEQVIRHALDLGINFFDTANGYSAGTSEEYLGRALKKNAARDKVVIASKVYFNPGRLSRAAIMREIDGTLRRLGTDYLDLYIIHRFDYETPIEETMEALHNLVKAGKVRALGASAMYGYQFYNMQLAARDHGWTPFSAMENHYNLLYREDERELIPICKQMGVSLMPYSPLAAGHLARPTWTSDSLRGRTDRVAMGKYDRTEAQDMQIVARVHELAERKGCKMSQIALQNVPDRPGLAVGQGSGVAHRRRDQSPLPRRCRRCAGCASDARGGRLAGRMLPAPPHRRGHRREPARRGRAAGREEINIEEKRCGAGFGLFHSVLFCLFPRQRHRHFAPFAVLAADVDLAAVQLDAPLNDGQAQP